jgi:hypothetical protein
MRQWSRSENSQSFILIDRFHPYRFVSLWTLYTHCDLGSLLQYWRVFQTYYWLECLGWCNTSKIDLTNGVQFCVPCHHIVTSLCPHTRGSEVRNKYDPILLFPNFCRTHSVSPIGSHVLSFIASHSVVSQRPWFGNPKVLEFFNCISLLATTSYLWPHIHIMKLSLNEMDGKMISDSE